jgi:hypothetical protein
VNNEKVNPVNDCENRLNRHQIIGAHIPRCIFGDLDQYVCQYRCDRDVSVARGRKQ